MSNIHKLIIKELENDMVKADEGAKEQFREAIEKIRAGRKPYPPEKLRSNKTMVCFNAAEYELLKSVSEGKEFAESIRELALEAARTRKNLDTAK